MGKSCSFCGVAVGGLCSRGAVGWSVVRDCGISLSYSLVFISFNSFAFVMCHLIIFQNFINIFI